MASASTDPLDLSTVLEALYDTFVKYLQPRVIIENMQIAHPFTDNADASCVIDWVLENVIEKTYVVNQFIHAMSMSLQKVGEPPVMSGETEDGVQVHAYTHLLIDMLDGSLFERLTNDDLSAASQAMAEKKLISQRQCDQLNKKAHILGCHKSCLELFKVIDTAHFPDWPYIFFKTLGLKGNNLEQSQECDGSIEGASARVPEHIQRHEQEGSNAEESCEESASARMPDPSDWQYLSRDSSAEESCEKKKICVTKEELGDPMIQLLRNGALGRNVIRVVESVDNPEQDTIYDGYFSDEDSHSDESTATGETQSSLNLRKYQEELAETALEGHNTIICAPTGSGKTRVATHIILRHLEGPGVRKKVAFLTQTVPLVKQQCKSVEKYLPSRYKVTNVTGDSVHCGSVHMILPEYDVIFMTPKILENHLTRKHIPNLGEFSLLIFDECHHTRKNEPYNTLMVSYFKTKIKQPEIKLPQIVGLTASIGVENSSNLDGAVERVLRICGNLDSNNISTVEKNKEELASSIAVPFEVVCELQERNGNEAVNKIVEVMTKLEGHMEQCVHDLQNELDEFVSTTLKKKPSEKKSQQYQQWLEEMRRCVVHIRITENSEVKFLLRLLLILQVDYLKAYNVALQNYDMVQLSDVLDYLKIHFKQYQKKENKTTAEETYYHYFEELERALGNGQPDENPNLTLLAEKLQHFLVNRGPECRGIIFVSSRALANALRSWLSRSDQLSALNASIFTGTGASADSGGMTQKDQESVIQQFRNGEVRLLVATSVAEEGLDIQDCSLVIKYNHVGNEVTTVQTKGRSRKKGGMSILLAMKKVCEKEIINRARVKLMNEAVEEINKKDLREIQEKIRLYQDEMRKEQETAETLKRLEKAKLLDEPFTMECLLCKKVTIDSNNIRTINGSHHVAVDRNLLDEIKIVPYSDSKCFDQVRMLGAVRCKYCNNRLGNLIIYDKNTFVLLTVSRFLFVTLKSPSHGPYQKWKDANYKIGKIKADDIRRYIRPETSERDSTLNSGPEYIRHMRPPYQCTEEPEYQNSNENTDVKVVSTSQPQLRSGEDVNVPHANDVVLHPNADDESHQLHKAEKHPNQISAMGFGSDISEISITTDDLEISESSCSNVESLGS